MRGTQTSEGSGRIARARALAGPVAGLVTLVFLSWGLGRPALWLDESASVVAVHRPWPDLFRLRQGADAPLVPYYVVLKAVTGGLRALSPGLAADPEVLYRLTSAVAVSLAAGLLVGWLARRASLRLALVTAALMLLTSGVSRYGQEARPYGLALLGAVGATVLWTGMVGDGRRRWPVGYALVVAAMVAMHDLTAVLVVAHGVAALVAVAPGRRRTALRRTAVAGGLGLLLVSPLALTAIWNGRGASRVVPLTPLHLLSAFTGLFSLSTGQILGVGPIVLLAVIGLSRVRASRDRFVAGLAASWALVPPALLLPAVVLRPNLLLGRYLLFTVPAWVVLAGLGAVAVADAAPVVAHRPWLRIWSAGVVLTGVLVATLVVQGPALAQVRTAQGHGENIRPALAIAADRADSGLPIVVSTRLGPTEVAAYDPAVDHRLVGVQVQPASTMIWPNTTSWALRRRQLTGDSRVLLLLQDDAGPCTQHAGVTAEAEISRCMPPTLHRLGYRPVTPGTGGWGWSISTLVRSGSRSPQLLHSPGNEPAEHER
jgi:hypothetical protein